MLSLLTAFEISLDYHLRQTEKLMTKAVAVEHKSKALYERAKKLVEEQQYAEDADAARREKTKERQTIEQLRAVLAQRDDLQLKVDGLEREVGELQAEKYSKDYELRRQTMAKEVLQRQYRELAAKSDTSTKDNMHAEIQKLKVELSELRDVESSLERTTRDLQTANGEIHRVQSSAAQLRDKLADKESIIEKGQKELAEQMKGLAQAAADKEKLEKKVLDLQTKMQGVNDELVSRSADVKKLQQADVRWKKACDEANARTMAVEESLRVAQANRETKEANWETERERLLAVSSELQTKTSEAENRIEDLQKSNSALHSRCEDFDAKEIEEDPVEQLDETRRRAERSESEAEHTIEETRDHDELKLRMTEPRDANQQTSNDNTVHIESERDTLLGERDDAVASLEEHDATIGEMKNQLHSQSSELHQQRIDNEDLLQERNEAVESSQQTTVRVCLPEAQLEETNSRYQTQTLEEEHSSPKMRNELVVVDNNTNEEGLSEVQQQLTEIGTSKDVADKLCQEKEDEQTTPNGQQLDSHNLQQFLSDDRDLTEWINGVMPLMTSGEMANDVTGAEALLERHREHRTDIDAKDGTFHAFEQFGDELIQAGHYAAPQVRERMEKLAQARDGLEKAWDSSCCKLEQCLDLQLFYHDALQTENWMARHEAFFTQQFHTVPGTMASVKELIKKHESFEIDLEVNRKWCGENRKLVSGGNHHGDEVGRRLDALMQRLTSLAETAQCGLERLLHTRDYLRFMRKCERVESWIEKKDRKIQNAGFGRDLTSLQILVTKQEEFDDRLDAGRIGSLTDLKDELMAEEHPQAPAIQERHSDVMNRWQRLVADSQSRYVELLRLQVEKTYMSIAVSTPQPPSTDLLAATRRIQRDADIDHARQWA